MSFRLVYFVWSIFLFSPPYDLAVHLTNDFYEKLHSAKWSDRKNAIQELIDLMDKNPSLAPKKEELRKLIDELIKILGSDSNINVAAVAATCLSKIAYGASELFKPYASAVILTCLTRSKDVKPIIKNACSDCLDMVYAETVSIY
jgi:cytoskeleton-associated protein 5